jgi:hypothetical protein
MKHWNAANTILFLIRSSRVAFLIPTSKSEDLISTQCTSLLRMVASIMQRRVPVVFHHGELKTKIAILPPILQL